MDHGGGQRSYSSTRGLQVTSTFNRPAISRRDLALGLAASTLAPGLAVAAPKAAVFRDVVADAPDWLAKPKGPVIIVVSIADQRLTLYDNGVSVASTPVSTGVPEHPTPRGVFSILQKQRHHKSNIYSDAPMPFMQRITWSGVALHEGHVTGRPASHGCVRLPKAFAERLWPYTRMGMRVIIAEEDARPFEFSHPRLFTARPREAAATVPPRQYAQAATGEEPAPEPPAPLAFPPGPGHVSMFVSRKEGKLFIRRDFAPLHETPVEIMNPARPLGLHVFTAMELRDGGSVRWTALDMPDPPAPPPAPRPRKGDPPPVPVLAPPPSSASEALDRIAIPDDVRNALASVIHPGASLVVSDQGFGKETGKGTDFIVLTR